MLPVPPSQQRSRGPENELHRAAFNGCTELVDALLSSGSIDINEGDPHGLTPLMYAALQGHSHVIKILLNKGASVSVGGDDSCLALLFAIKDGHLAVTKMLVTAGANVNAPPCGGYTPLHTAAEMGHSEVTRSLIEAGAEVSARSSKGSTPLHTAAEKGHLEVMRSLIEARANPNSRAFDDGATPLYGAALVGGCVEAIKILLRAGANPLLSKARPSGADYLPLDAEAQGGHLEVVRELIQQCGIGGCGGASGGLLALEIAAQNEHGEIMAMLVAAGVVDTGKVLNAAAGSAGYLRETSVKFLLQQEWNTTGKGAYVNNTSDHLGRTPLLFACGLVGFPSPRIVRVLVDAGADTTSAVLLPASGGLPSFNGTPLALTTRLLHTKKIARKAATKKQLHRLKAIRRCCCGWRQFMQSLGCGPAISTLSPTL